MESEQFKADELVFNLQRPYALIYSLKIIE